jgi:ATP-dependent protease ClpP protease subunit
MKFTVALSISLAAIMAVSSSLGYAQATPTRTAIISFVGVIDANSTSALLRSVNEQAKAGVTNVTILIASPGGDTASAFAAYNVLRSMPLEVTTFNVGNVDSAAILLYCAGQKRYSLPATRFLIHGNSFNPAPNTSFDAAALDAQLAQVKSLNQIVMHVLAVTAQKKDAEIEAAVHGQQILTPEQAKQWGIVQDIRENFMVAGATMISVNGSPATDDKKSPLFSSVTSIQSTEGLESPIF